MEAATADEPRRFDNLREHSIGLTQVLFQSITHMAEKLRDMDRVYVEGETVAPEATPAPEPA
jgi:hypothetical protein